MTHSTPQNISQNDFHGTTILCLKKADSVVIAADGQVSLGNCIVKSRSRKIRTIANNSIIAGFAGSTADALTLFDKLEKKLETYSNQLIRAAVELAKDWRADKYLRRLEAMLIVADRDNIFLLSGAGDIIEPDDKIAAIGSGGFYALSAAKAFMSIENDLSATEIAKKSISIAADICVFSNHNIVTEEIRG